MAPAVRNIFRSYKYQFKDHVNILELLIKFIDEYEVITSVNELFPDIVGGNISAGVNTKGK